MVRACAASIAIVVVAAAGCTRPSPDLLEPEPGETEPDPPLVDEAGTPRRLSDWKGRVLAVTFTYTRCPLPNFCPLMDRNPAAVQDIIERFASRFGVSVIREDPRARWTPADLLTDLRTTSAHR